LKDILLELAAYCLSVNIYTLRLRLQYRLKPGFFSTVSQRHIFRNTAAWCPYQ